MDRLTAAAAVAEVPEGAVVAKAKAAAELLAPGDGLGLAADGCRRFSGVYPSPLDAAAAPAAAFAIAFEICRSGPVDLLRRVGTFTADSDRRAEDPPARAAFAS